MKKQKKVVEVVARNFVVKATFSRSYGSGVHGKSQKAQRRQDKVAFRKEAA